MSFGQVGFEQRTIAAEFRAHSQRRHCRDSSWTSAREQSSLLSSKDDFLLRSLRPRPSIWWMQLAESAAAPRRAAQYAVAKLRLQTRPTVAWRPSHHRRRRPSMSSLFTFRIIRRESRQSSSARHFTSSPHRPSAFRTRPQKACMHRHAPLSKQCLRIVITQCANKQC